MNLICANNSVLALDDNPSSLSSLSYRTSRGHNLWTWAKLWAPSRTGAKGVRFKILGQSKALKWGGTLIWPSPTRTHSRALKIYIQFTNHEKRGAQEPGIGMCPSKIRNNVKRDESWGKTPHRMYLILTLLFSGYSQDHCISGLTKLSQGQMVPLVVLETLEFIRFRMET